jgi:hypothetical protein
MTEPCGDARLSAKRRSSKNHMTSAFGRPCALPRLLSIFDELGTSARGCCRCGGLIDECVQPCSTLIFAPGST